jgi:hypothetical protein
MFKKAIALSLAVMLAACEVPESPRVWDDYLDPYMSARGYTIDVDGKTILKNGFPVWVDEPCFGRGCRGSYPIVTRELAEAVRLDLLAAIDAAQDEYVADISEVIGLEPVVDEPEKTEQLP